MWYAHTEARKYKHIPKHVLRTYLYAIVIFITAEQFRPVITAFYKFSQLCAWFFRRNGSRARFPKSHESRYHISCRLSFCSLNRARSNKIAEQSSGLSAARPLKETVVCAFSGCSSTLLLSSLLRYVLVCAYQHVPDLCSSSLFLDLPLRTGKCSSLRILQALCINQLLSQVLPTAWKAVRKLVTWPFASSPPLFSVLTWIHHFGVHQSLPNLLGPWWISKRSEQVFRTLCKTVACPRRALPPFACILCAGRPQEKMAAGFSSGTHYLDLCQKVVHEPSVTFAERVVQQGFNGSGDARRQAKSTGHKPVSAMLRYLASDNNLSSEAEPC